MSLASVYSPDGGRSGEPDGLTDAVCTAGARAWRWRDTASSPTRQESRSPERSSPWQHGANENFHGLARQYFRLVRAQRRSRRRGRAGAEHRPRKGLGDPNTTGPLPSRDARGSPRAALTPASAITPPCRPSSENPPTRSRSWAVVRESRGAGGEDGRRDETGRRR